MIWCDLDGVLADFELAYLQRFGHDCTTVSKAEKWKNVNSTDDFYQYLPWTQFGREIWRLIMPTGAHILTAVAKSVPPCQTQKFDWCRRELGIRSDRIVVVRDKEDKAMYCEPGDVLLDDREDVVNWWRKRGGYAMLITPDHNVEAAVTALDLWRANQDIEPWWRL